MPIYNKFHIKGRADGSVQFLPQALQKNGPVLDAEVRFDSQLAKVTKAANLPVPPGIPARFLIDTGAQTTCVNQSILDKLQVLQIGDTEVCTPSSTTTRGVYACGLAFPGSPLESIPDLFVIGCDLSSQPYDGLIGRDILARAVLVYNGGSGSWSLALS